MWLSQQGKQKAPERAQAQVGETTISGREPAVQTEGELRDVTVYAPGGYCWRPSEGEQVLVMKAGVYGEESCVVGTPCRSEALYPGEVWINGPSCSILMSRDGVIHLSGLVLVNGRPVLTGGEND